MNRIKLLSLALCLLSLIFTSIAFAEAEQTQQDNNSPYFLVRSGEGTLEQFPLKSTQVQGKVAGVITEFEVQQTYKNTGKTAIEATYVFPASTNAAIHSMKIRVADRTIEAVIEKREEARIKYEQAKVAGYTTALLEEQRPNVFTMDVGNILPGDEVNVDFTYSELLKPEEGTYQIVYPTVVGPRYAGAANGGGQTWNNNPYLAEGEVSPATFSFALDIASPLDIARINSKSHKLKTDYQGPKQVHIELAQDEQNRDNHDIIIDYQLAGQAIQSGLSLYQGENENFFLLQVEPPTRVASSIIVPREYIFIVDTSGSMAGFPLTISQKLIAGLLGNLRSSDRFNIIFFAGGNWSYAAQSVSASSSEVSKALQALNNIQGGGGTELLPAVKLALSTPKPEGFSRSFVIATDGYVTIEPQAYDLVRAEVGNANFFPFGIGTSVNRSLIEGLAHAGKSEPFIVTNENDADEAVQKFQKYVESPLLTEIEIKAEGFEIADAEPAIVPDLLAERPVTIIGKWSGQASGSIVVKARSGNTNFEKRIDVSSVIPSSDNHALSQLWARERIKLLADYYDLAQRSDIAEKVTELGLKYHLVTQFTSFLAIDSIERNSTGFTSVRQPLALPRGVSSLAVGSGYTGNNNIGSNVGTYSGNSYDSAEFNDERISNSFDRVLTFLEGSFGALIMLSFGLAAIVFALVAGATKNRRYILVATLCLILAISVYVTRSFISSYFNTSDSALIGE